MINLSDVNLVLEIAKSGSISKAAENLYMSQPNLSKRLKRFETDIGLKLFERGGSGIKLTYDGRKFVDSASSIMEDLQMLEKSINRERTQHKLELNVASTSFYFMRPAIAELCRRYPDIPMEVRYTEAGNEEQINLIEKGRVDIGIIATYHKEVGIVRKMAKIHGVEYHTLCQGRAFVALSENSRLYPSSINILERDRLLKMFLITISPFGGVMRNNNSAWPYVNRVLALPPEQQGLREIGTNNTGTAHELLTLLDGFTLVIENEGLYQHYGHFKNVRLLPLPKELDANYEIGWLQLSNTMRRPLADEFINLLSSHVAAD